ncbi:hypothetical protein [Pseudomonas koreensis]|uniref:hypothetical protein n=1 Tax=Pseudomonas koreensis TaxID=198620 RepID=UPI001B342781|nr:hypothetical protein [Pseudomonas koreensis]MBP3996715.1 hypothetical protein [Pseudomonas koreensis]
MQRSEQPHIELDKAKKSLEAMKVSTSIEDLEENWKTYLHRLERTWNRVLHHYGKSPKWNGWQASVLKHRKNDPLLSYLINARGCDEHTGEDIVSRKGRGFGLSTNDDAGLRIDSFVIGSGGFSFKGSSNVVFDFYPASISMKSIVNRGRDYPPPTEHLGAPLSSSTMIDMAQLGIDYYDDLINKVEIFFVK